MIVEFRNMSQFFLVGGEVDWASYVHKWSSEESQFRRQHVPTLATHPQADASNTLTFQKGHNNS